MKPEQALWKLIKPHVPGHAERIENAAGKGMLDVNYCHKSKEKWLELKVSSNKRMLSPYQTVQLLRAEQKVFCFNRVRNGGTCLMLVRQGESIALWKIAVDYPVPMLTAEFVVRIEKPFDWPELTNRLVNT